jgi:hypothetical protein
MLGDHKPPEHHYERIIDIETKQKEEIKNLMQESRSKTKFCEDASMNLTNSLSELQLQRDNAKGLIQETFQSYKVVLEKVQVSSAVLSAWFRQDSLFGENGCLESQMKTKKV